MWLFEGKSQVVRLRGRRIRCHARWLDDRAQFVEGAIEYPSLIECIRQRRPETLAIRRTIGVGDLIMLMAAARALLRAMEPHGLRRIVLVVRRDWFEWAQALSDGRIDYARDRGVTDYGAEIHYDANSCLSLDHKGPPWADFHRVALYARSWGYETAVMT